MQFTQIRKCGTDITVIKANNFYYFYNEYFGLLAMAELIECTDSDFYLWTGNKHTVGTRLTDNECTAMAKRFITRTECQQYKRQINFIECEADLSKWSLEIKANYNDRC